MIGLGTILVVLMGVFLWLWFGPYQSNRVNRGRVDMETEQDLEAKVLSIDEKVPFDSTYTIEYQPTKPLFGNGTSEEPYIVADLQDSLWQQYQPQNLVVKANLQNHSVLMSFDASEITPNLDSWLVGYWFEPFNPVEKFNIQNLTEAEMVRWQSIKVPEINNRNRQPISVEITELDSEWTTIYLFLYVRLRTDMNGYVDLIYGNSDNPTTPIKVTLK